MGFSWRKVMRALSALPPMGNFAVAWDMRIPWEHTVQLHPHHFGGGVGRAIMLHTLEHAKAHGAHSMFAGVSSGNPAGVQFHDRLGFEKVTTLREVGRKFDQWLDLVLMQKML